MLLEKVGLSFLLGRFTLGTLTVKHGVILCGDFSVCGFGFFKSCDSVFPFSRVLLCAGERSFLQSAGI